MTDFPILQGIAMMHKLFEEFPSLHAGFRTIYLESFISQEPM